jgi:hypothetical protein
MNSFIMPIIYIIGSIYGIKYSKFVLNVDLKSEKCNNFKSIVSMFVMLCFIFMLFVGMFELAIAIWNF